MIRVRAWLSHRRRWSVLSLAIVGMTWMLAATVGYGQAAGKRRVADTDSEIPNALETIGATNVPIIDGKPLHPPTIDTPLRQTKQQSTRKGEGKPSIFGRIGADTKRFFTAAGQFFSIRRTETKSRIVQNTGWQQPGKQQKKTRWFGSLFEAEKPAPATPQEWLSQPRPTMF